LGNIRPLLAFGRGVTQNQQAGGRTLREVLFWLIDIPVPVIILLYLFDAI
jgi:hypothetical protein